MVLVGFFPFSLPLISEILVILMLTLLVASLTFTFQHFLILSFSISAIAHFLKILFIHLRK